MRAIDADAFDERVRAAGGMSEEELTEDFKDEVQAVLYMLSIQPAQPEKRTGERTETHACDSISRQAAIEALRDYLVGKNVPCDGTLTCRLIENEVINKLPPAQPEIIRCKDCKHFKQVLAPNDNDGLCGHWHSKCDARTSREGYCSHAERREVTE